MKLLTKELIDRFAQVGSQEGVNCPICPDIENMKEELNEYENQITDLEKELEEIKTINS